MMKNRLDDVFRESKNESSLALKKMVPAFDLKVGICSDYESLLSGTHDREANISELRRLAHRTGRVLISARAGAGKSTLMRRLLLEALEDGEAAVYFELKTWGQSDTDTFMSPERTPVSFFDRMLRRFADERLDVAALDLLPALRPKLILIDGLNETPGQCADRVITAADEAAALFPGLSVILSDRLVRRELSQSARWGLVTILPLGEDQIKEVVGSKLDGHKARELLKIPFFLDRAIAGELRDTPEMTVIEMVHSHTSLNDAEIEKLTRAAFEIYQAHKSRTFSASDISDDLRIPLVESGLLTLTEQDQFSFSHHSVHDYLASLYVAGNDALWKPEVRHNTFDAITFGANSFDAIASVLRVLSASKDQTKSSDLLRAVYDWNPYAAGYALTEAEAKGSALIAPDMRAIVLFMLGLRLFDHQLSTQRRARDALLMFADDLARNILAAKSLENLVALAEKQTFESETFKNWVSVFAMSGDAITAPDVLDAITGQDSVSSWTLANVVKLTGAAIVLERRLIELSTHKNFVVRWRSVHALGAAPSDAAIEALFLRLFIEGEKEGYVRYGAIRSLVEIALMSPPHRSQILDRFVEDLPRIKKDSTVLNEFVNAAFADQKSASADWPNALAPIFHRLIDLAESAEEIDRWSGILADLYMLYQASAA